MSPEASRVVSDIRSLFESAGEPAHQSWYFHAGHGDPAHDELARLGLIMKVLGTARGFAWRLTDSGLRAIRAQQP